MKTSLGFEGKLSRKQLTRLGGLIAFICGRTPYPAILHDLSDNGFIEVEDGCFKLSESGMAELLRLTAMAGLRPEHFTDDGDFRLLHGA